MSAGKRICWMILGLVVLGPSIAIGYWCWTPGICVDVANRTSGALTQVDIAYTGGVLHIPELKSNAACGRRINPDGDSHLELSWTDSAGEKHVQRLDLYFERNYRGRVDITVQPDHRIAWTDRTRSSAW